MDFFSKIDIISPLITLYYEGRPSHPSIFSGLLSIISYLLMLCFASYYLFQYLKKENPTAFFFNRYVEDAGNFPLNSSSIFSFLQLVNTSQESKIIAIDFDSVRFIGIEVTIDNYVAYSDLTNYDHWIYGYCNNDTDIEGISYLVNSNNFYQSACIRKYYNKTTGKYYETSDVNFRWPMLTRGCSNSDATYYGIIVEKCRNDSLRVNLENKFCKPDSEINNYMAHTSIKFKIVDHFADVLNYKEPFTKYFYEITNGLFGETFTTNHLNFNPAIMKTHKGFIYEKIEEKYTYYFSQNEKITTSTGNTGIYIAFYFWMQNTMQYYERKYQLVQDVLSNIGGITRTILLIANLINYISSYYIILIDSEELFIGQNEKRFKEKINDKNAIEEQIKKDINNPNPPKKFQLYNNRYQKNNVLANNYCLMKKNVNHSKLSTENCGIYSSKRNKNNLQNNEKNRQNKYLVYNRNNYFSGNNYFYYERKEQRKRREIEQINPPYIIKNNNSKDENDNSDRYIKENNSVNDLSDKCNKKEFNFFKFISYIICCHRNNENMNYIEELRYKVLSEETIVQCYLNLKEMNKLPEFLK